MEICSLNRVQFLGAHNSVKGDCSESHAVRSSGLILFRFWPPGTAVPDFLMPPLWLRAGAAGRGEDFIADGRSGGRKSWSLLSRGAAGADARSFGLAQDKLPAAGTAALLSGGRAALDGQPAAAVPHGAGAPLLRFFLLYADYGDFGEAFFEGGGL